MPIPKEARNNVICEIQNDKTKFPEGCWYGGSRYGGGSLRCRNGPGSGPRGSCGGDRSPTEHVRDGLGPTLPPFEKYDPDVVLMVEDTGQTFKEGDTYDNNPMYNLRRDLMGIRFEPHWTAAGDARAAKRAADIAGGTMADYFVCNTVEAAEFIANGAAEDIRDVVDATYSPCPSR